MFLKCTLISTFILPPKSNNFQSLHVRTLWNYRPKTSVALWSKLVTRFCLLKQKVSVKSLILGTIVKAFEEVMQDTIIKYTLHVKRF